MNAAQIRYRLGDIGAALLKRDQRQLFEEIYNIIKPSDEPMDALLYYHEGTERLHVKPVRPGSKIRVEPQNYVLYMPALESPDSGISLDRIFSPSELTIVSAAYGEDWEAYLELPENTGGSLAERCKKVRFADFVSLFRALATHYYEARRLAERL
jgi:hypothetical protein